MYVHTHAHIGTHTSGKDVALDFTLRLSFHTLCTTVAARSWTLLLRRWKDPRISGVAQAKDRNMELHLDLSQRWQSPNTGTIFHHLTRDIIWELDSKQRGQDSNWFPYGLLTLVQRPDALAQFLSQCSALCVQYIFFYLNNIHHHHYLFQQERSRQFIKTIQLPKLFDQQSTTARTLTLTSLKHSPQTCQVRFPC